jgi:hypothetical protein
LCAGITVATSYLVARTVVDQGLDAAELKAQKLRSDISASGHERPVLYGIAHAGNAWDDYESALAGCNALAPSALRKAVESAPGEDFGDIRETLRSHANVLVDLARGTHRMAARIPRRPMSGVPVEFGSRDASDLPAYLAVLRARDLVKSGDIREGIRALFDVCQYGRDMADDSGLINELTAMRILGAGLTELDRCMALPVGRDVLLELKSALQRLDEHFPDHRQVLRNEALASYEMIADERSGLLYHRLRAKSAVGHLISWIERACDAEGRPWLESRQLMQEIQKEADRSGNAYVHRIPIPYLSEPRVRARRAQLRLLRAAVSSRLGESMPELVDPFGSTPSQLLGRDALKVWSVGPDGKDDGGVGGWDYAAGKDIVLSLSR